MLKDAYNCAPEGRNSGPTPAIKGRHLDQVSSPSTFSKLVRHFVAAAVIASGAAALVDAQIPGRNVNMVSGRSLPGGDPYLQRQNEPSVAASTRNPLHLLAGANDYRTVDIPGLPGDNETGDAWMGVFKSYDGGNTWRSTLIPGFPQDAGSNSPLRINGYTAGADPVVRAGTNGLFYYSGIAFTRAVPATATTPAVPAKSAMFVSRFIDNNNQETGDPIVFVDTKLVQTNDGTAFIDKPWFAVDIPRAGAQTCTITTQQRSPTQQNPNAVKTVVNTFPGGAAYATYTLITGDGASLRSQIYLSRSTDCGATWSAPLQISSINDPINQGATLAIDPRDGTLYLAWRRFTADGTDDSIMVTRSMDQGRKWDPPGRARRFPRGNKVGLDPEMHGKRFKRPTELAELASLDQPTREDLFRTNAYPSMTVDHEGRVYVAWSERGFAPLNDLEEGDARILIASSTNGASWTMPVTVDNTAAAGHQVMPSISSAGGKLMVAYYDFRDDVSGVFRKFVDETSAVTFGNKRHTVDVRAAMATPGPITEFGPSVRVSEYLMGNRPNTPPGPVEQLQFNPPNLKLFQLGTVPFFGDYIDLAPSPSFVPTGTGGWTYNTAPASSPLFHAVWTDNRDVVPPINGDWKTYTPPASATGTPNSACVPGREGMRNQNIYTARITGGLIAGSPGNTKPLDPILPRGFVVFAQNATEVTRTFRMTIQNQPVGGKASFLQASLLPAVPGGPAAPAIVTTLDVTVPRRSTIARNVYATSTDPNAQINVSVKEIAVAGGAETAGGLQSTVILNPDISNPDISNPDISNPDISNPDISNAEVSNPDISNPDISNPDISNPDISNPDISNPDISNVQVANPDISNPDISNPDISNPDISNPDISNPDISNSTPGDDAMRDTTWTVTNDGNTTTSFSVKLLLNGLQPSPNQIALQLILHKVYFNQVAVACVLKNQPHNQLLANITNPVFANPQTLTNPDVQNSSASNATLWLAPGESAKITLRVRDLNVADAVTFEAAQLVTPVVVPQAKDVAVVGGVLIVDDDVAVTVPLNATFLNLPVNAASGVSMGPVSVQVKDTQGAVVPAVPVTLSIRSVPSNAQIGSSYLSTTNSDGTATFNLGGVPAGTYRLLAQADLIGQPPASAWSPEFVVGPGPVLAPSGKFYEYVRVPGLSWTQARDAAAARSHAGVAGRLVTIADAAENQFVNNLKGAGTMRAWIGMIDPDGSDDISGLSWITGEPVTYTNWGPGEPNNPNLEFHVEMFTDGTWNNNQNLDPTPSFRTLGYIVEYEPKITFVVTSIADDGSVGTLRQAITSANANGASADRVAFNIPGVGPHLISLNSALPAITQPVSIDGTTQPSYAGAPLVFVDGADVLGAPGLRLEAGASEIRGIGLIGFGSGPAIQLWSGGNGVVRGNYIGLTGSGPASGNATGIEVHSAGNRIGGGTALDRNVISGNQVGISLESSSSDTVIIGNYIGTNPAGTAQLANDTGILGDDAGSVRIGALASGGGNLVSGNTTGMRFTGSANNIQILNNYIGVNVTGTAALGNATLGIHFTGDADNNVFDGNIIAFNGGAGLAINEGVGNSILMNSIYDNGGLGIDHGFLNVTANDATETDGIQNFPVVTSAQNVGGGVQVQGTLNSTPNTAFQIRFFVSPTCNNNVPSSFGEGQTQFGVINSTSTNVDGQLNFNVAFAPALITGHVVTATARNLSNNNTSEFSQCVVVSVPAPAPAGLVFGTPSELPAPPLKRP